MLRDPLGGADPSITKFLCNLSKFMPETGPTLLCGTTFRIPSRAQILEVYFFPPNRDGQEHETLRARVPTPLPSALKSFRNFLNTLEKKNGGGAAKK